MLDRLEAQLADVRAASAVEYYDLLLSPCMIPYFPNMMPYFPNTADVYMDRRGGHSRLLQDISSSSTKRGKLFECSVSRYEIMTASRVKGSNMYGLGSVCTFQSLQTVPA